MKNHTETPFGPFWRRLRFALISAVLGAGLLLMGCSQPAQSSASSATNEEVPEDAAVAYFASGCFWCVEAVYESVEGVYEAVSGYAGGDEKNPTYEQVASGRSDHAEAVQVFYDPDKVSFSVLVDVFFGSQNPTQVNGQGPDRGTQYRSIIFYSNEQEREIAVAKKAELDASGKYKRPIAAEIAELTKFWRAEEYHQNYERNNPNNPYVRNVSIPRLKKFQKKFPDILKGAHPDS